MGLLRIQLRRLRAEGLAGVALVVLVFFTALALAIAPRLLERLANEALITGLSAVPSVERNILVMENSRSTAPPLDGLSGAQAATARVEPAMARSFPRASPPNAACSPMTIPK